MEETTSVEYLLLDYVKRVARSPAGRRAVIIHLSRLRPDNRRAHHIRIAASTFESLVKQLDGQVFLLQNADIVFVCKDASVAVIDEAVTRLRYLFGDDPLAAELDENDPDHFATWYDLERDPSAFLTFVGALHKQETRRQKRLAALAGTPLRDERQPLDAAALAELVNTVARADLSNMLRQQMVCAIVPDEPPRPIFREIYVSIPDLRDAVMPRRDITADPWLFQHLTQMLDKRVLSLLRRNDDRVISYSYSLNLNISTLLSQGFTAFDQSLRTRARGTIVIELQKVDVFADLGAYVFARDYLRERGYRICIDGVTALTLPFIDRERLGLDLVKLFWSPDMADAHRSERLDELRAALERAGKTRVILARCDSEEAVQFGQSIGLRLFQGRHVDRLLNMSMAGRVGAERRPGTPLLAS
jgi:EAL domain-containing protein (putative c-di-GMP-specific phosphodiesterase class I)